MLWNFFSFSSYITFAPGVANLSGIRTFRVFRALRTISAVKGLWFFFTNRKHNKIRLYFHDAFWSPLAQLKRPWSIAQLFPINKFSYLLGPLSAHSKFLYCLPKYNLKLYKTNFVSIYGPKAIWTSTKW